ncbi:cytochrome c/c1 heme lyase-domain-containing protein [Chlamydoabsidia padenii]|nr:cytochrome c/c1 heme lyase-domain-containing protein [Chlamydoabsidia padenii]
MAEKRPIDDTKDKKSETAKASSTPPAHTEGSTLTPVHDESKCPVDPATYRYYTQAGSIPSASPTAHASQHALYETSSTSALEEHAKVGSTVDDESKCPVDPSAYKHFIPQGSTSYQHLLPHTSTDAPQTTATEEGCASDTMNMSNHMPHISQQPLPDQKGHLGKHREISTIPRASHEEKLWVYPSEQMFFNAMRRKNWNPDESDMPVVVPIHNAVNEQAWQKILEFERLHETECNQPKLLKFQGRPKDITPKARLRSWLGYALPFDRHDWTVDRCGEKVTYVIDFYAGKQDPKRPNGVSFYLDVRPAVSPSGIWDRVRMAFKKGEFV